MEKDIEKKVRLAVERLGGRLNKWVCPGEKGNPDRILILPGNDIRFIEFKQPGGILSDRQKLWRKWLMDLGCQHYIIGSMEEADHFICNIHHTPTRKE